MSESFTPVGQAANKVVIDLAARRQLVAALKGSVAMLDAQAEQAAQIARARAFNCDVAKRTITKAISDLRDNSSADEAIEFLKDTLMAIGGPA